jgi:hypothetical protein
MQRQQGLSSPVPKQQQDDGSGSDAFQQMVLTEEESASSSKADKERRLEGGKVHPPHPATHLPLLPPALPLLSRPFS